VTGASRGLGAAMAEALAGAGASVALHATAKPAGSTATQWIAADLGDPRSSEYLIAETIARFGRIDILINNAGIIRRQPAAEHSDEFWDSVIDVNLSSVFRLCRNAGKHMIERGEGGKIVNIASLLSFQGGITVPGYAAAKGGVRQLTRGMAVELAPHGIQVNAIAPGYFATEMNRALLDDEAFDAWVRKRTPAGRWGEPDEIAGLAVFLASSAANYITGQTIMIDGGMSVAL